MCKDKLDYLIGLASAGCGDDDVEMFNNLDTSKVMLDREFYRIRDSRIRKHKRAPFVKTMRKVLTRVAVFVLAVVSATTVTVAAIPSLRKAVFNAIGEWYEDYLTINYELPEVEETESESGIETNVDSEADASVMELEIVRPTKIEQVKKPLYYGEGVIEDIAFQGRNQVLIDYYLEEQLLYSYKQIVFSEDEMYINNESAIVENLTVNGHVAYFVELIDVLGKKVIWTDGIYIFQLYTESANKDLLLAVAESVE